MPVDVPVVHVMVWCGVVRRLEWVACGGRLRSGMVAIQLAGVAVGGIRVQGSGGPGGVVMWLVVPCPLALREWWSCYGVDVCGRWSLFGLPC